MLVIRPGLLTTIQDLGRWGMQSYGVPVGGPMDSYSHRLANRLVGNPDAAAALEITLSGPELRAEGDLVCAIAGGDFGVVVSGEPVHHSAAFRVPSGATIRFRERRTGARATLAVRGGLDVPPVFGSCATTVSVAIGPLDGRPLRAGDRVPVGQDLPRASPAARRQPLGLPRGGARLRAMRGPDDDSFAPIAIETFFTTRYSIGSTSNRMGYRLEGSRLTHSGAADVLSQATPLGSVQVPGSGLPILLMADRGTTGGYPRVATVVTADIPLAGQLAPGDWIEFVPCTRDEAVEALRLQERRLGAPCQ